MPKTIHKAKPKARTRQRSAARENATEGGAHLPRSLWSGTLSFGLVTIPVELFAATRNNRRSLRMLSEDGTPLSRRYFSATGKALENEDLERGYQLEDGKFVVVEDEELERLLPEQSRDIDLKRFVPLSSIPPLYFERAYILAPAHSGTSAYRLLSATMERLGQVGIATFVMRERQYMVAITARDGLLRAETLRFQDELRTPKSVGLSETAEPSARALAKMRAAVKSLSKTRVAERELADSYWQRLEKLVAKKRSEDRDVVAAEGEQSEESQAEVIDLMDVLRRSLSQKAPANDIGKRPGLKSTAGKPRARKKQAS